MSWINIKSLINLKVVASVGIWVFLVPAIVRLSDLFSGFRIDFGGSSANIQLAPMSLLFLYFSAVSFFLGSLIYQFFCPAFLKVVDSYTDFLEKNYNEFRLSEVLIGMKDSKSNQLTSFLRVKAAEAEVKDIDSGDFFTLIIGAHNNINLKGDQLSNAFWIIQEFLSKNNVFARFACTTFFSIGFILLTYIFFKNFALVIEYGLSQI